MYRIIAWLTALIAGIILFLAGLCGFLNTESGFRAIERYSPWLSDREVSVFGISGRFPDKLRIGRLEISDPEGIWMTIDRLELDWSLRHLLNGRAEIDHLSAAHIEMRRLAEYPEDPEEDNSLPVFFSFRALSVDRIDLGIPVAGTPMALTLQGSGQLVALDQGGADLMLRQLDAAGSYRVVGDVSPEGTRLNATITEPAQGLLAGLAGLPDVGPISAEGAMEGPWNASRVKVQMSAGALKVSARGSIDLEHESADLVVALTAPEMSPRTDLTWKSIQVNAKISGPFAGPLATGTLRIDELKAADTTVRRVAAEVQGDADQVQLQAEVMGLRVPGPRPELLESHPLTLNARMNLKAADRPVSFTLRHPVINSDGTVSIDGSRRAELAVNLPKLGLLAAAVGLDLQGTADLKLHVAEQGPTTRFDLDGKLGITAGQAPIPALIGPKAVLRASTELRGAELTIAALQFDGKALSLASDGRVGEKLTDLKFTLGLPELKALSDALRGKVSIQGTLSGPQTNLVLDTALAGELSAKGIPSGPFNAKLKAVGLPDAPSGTMTAQGTLDGAALALSMAAAPAAGGAVSVNLERLDWKSLHAVGAFSFPKGSAVPLGKLEARIGRLEDLRRLAGVPLTGSFTATVSTAQRDKTFQTQLRLDGQAIGVEGTAHMATLTGLTTVNDPLGRPAFTGQLALNEIRAGSTEGSVRVDFAGPKDAIGVRFHVGMPRLVDTPARLDAAATLDATRAELDLSSLQAAWKGEGLRLLRPARLTLGEIIAVEHLHLGLRQATLEIDGHISPDLDVSADLRDLPANLIALVAPDLALDGKLRADARLSGSLSRPRGSVHLDLSGAQARAAGARGLPSINLNVGALLDGDTARVDGRLTAGSNANLNLTGDVPLNRANALDLQADGSVDLKLLDPLLMAQGRRSRGRLTLNAGLRGTVSQPLITGGVQLSQGQFEDYAIGLRLSDMSASLQSDGDMIRIDRFEAHAGQGRVDARGSIGVLQEKLPIDLVLTARNARPLSSDRMTVTLDSNLTLHGEANQRLSAAGNIHIRRAEIRIPEHIPATIVVLDVREPGVPPPPPPKPGPDIGIDLTIDASDELFVRGRGLDAEMAGKIHLLGTANNPQPNGHFSMRRGQYTLMGKTLTFSRGEVGFDGGTLTNPTLDFIANATNANITATLGVGGTARKPTITLSSVPELPQDEVLAQLLFGRGSASLSPLELAQIAGALASLTGVTSGIYNPLETVRKGLGLDRLAVGSTKSGAPTLEAGRYVAPGVYLGAKQGFSGGSAIPQAAVQIDLTEGLKLEGTVGTGNDNASATSTGASSAGMIYQFEY